MKDITFSLSKLHNFNAGDESRGVIDPCGLTVGISVSTDEWLGLNVVMQKHYLEAVRKLLEEYHKQFAAADWTGRY